MCDDKTELFAPRRPRIFLKDHKDNFFTDPRIRLKIPGSSDQRSLSEII